MQTIINAHNRRVRISKALDMAFPVLVALLILALVAFVTLTK